MKETTLELLQRLKRIEIEKWNLGIETTQIMEEIWRRVDALDPEKDIEIIKKERTDIMLKIREDVNLNVLEKYGYELMEDWWNRPSKITVNNVEGEMIYYKHVAPYTSIEIEVKTRQISEQEDDMFTFVDEEYIQDLIQADLVVKVEK